MSRGQSKASGLEHVKAGACSQHPGLPHSRWLQPELQPSACPSGRELQQGDIWCPQRPMYMWLEDEAQKDPRRQQAVPAISYCMSTHCNTLSILV